MRMRQGGRLERLRGGQLSPTNTACPRPMRTQRGDWQEVQCDACLLHDSDARISRVDTALNVRAKCGYHVPTYHDRQTF